MTTSAAQPLSKHAAAINPSNGTRLLHRWLDSWRGIGDIVAGLARQDYDLELRRYDGRGWRAVFFPSGFEYSLTSHAGAAWARSPWEAVRRAAGDALYKLAAGERPARDGDGRVACVMWN